MKPCPFCHYSEELHQERVANQRTYASWDAFKPLFIEVAGTVYLECQNCWVSISRPAGSGARGDLENVWESLTCR